VSVGTKVIVINADQRADMPLTSAPVSLRLR
jgi:hypothetical protein